MLWAGGAELPVASCGSSGKVWLGDFEIPVVPPGVLTITGCALDQIGNRACIEAEVGVGLFTRDQGGFVLSPDGKLEVRIRPGCVPEATYLCLLPSPGPVGEETGMPISTYLLCEEPQPYAYTVSPRVQLGESVGEIRFFYSDWQSGVGVSPDHLLIEHSRFGPLRSYVDTEFKSVSAWTDDLATFRVIAAGPGSSKSMDPGFISVEPCIPNPFASSTRIRFELSAPQRIRVSVCDVRGRVIAEILDDYVYPGITQTQWDGTTKAGCSVPSGMYFVRFTGAATSAARKILVLR
jgi:hypothetical protein